MQKGFALIYILVGILVLGIVIGGVYYLGKISNKPIPTSQVSVTSTPKVTDETANWKTYTNNTYGYEIKFPDNYAVPTQTEKQKSQLSEGQNMCVMLAGTQKCAVVIDYWQESLNDVLKKEAPTDNSQPKEYSNQYVKGKMYVYKMGESTTTVLIIIPKPGSNIGVITLSYTNYPGDIETSKIIDRIISTFRFIN